MKNDFKTSSVRDLAWAMSSKSLLKATPEVVSDVQCLSILEHHYPWLWELDNNPEPLIQWLHANRSHRLGYYFEYLVAFWLRERIADEFFASHVRVFEEKRTIGEFDFLFKASHSDTLVHWETAVKFYLYYQAEDQKVWWHGPNAQDRLDIKTERVFNHQLKLGDSPQGSALLREKGFENVQAQTFFKGYLFYPVTSDWCHPQSLPDIISPGHSKGWWSRINKFELPDYEADDRWLVLPRLEWLAPKVVHQEQDSGMMDIQQLIDNLEQHFDRGRESLLLAQMVKGENSCWYEKTRGFVVSSVWPNQRDRNQK